ncbi:FAD-linked oxidoreductase [Sistotremastrum niveocremeum HHB9708]|uniref:Proline dehydrogenase n=1 Tax=Sistotremastrum niveocremeum HHB9708 TaxID=1314777 RepID=A0A164R4I0_9AGAM|nr:FAD-linked oxidoreductase [Sistotremastrum niveocremeum HHB9708]
MFHLHRLQPRAFSRVLSRTASTSQSSRSFRRLATRSTLVSIVGATGLLLYNNPVHADSVASASSENVQRHREPASLSSLIRSYGVYTICSVPVIVDWSPALLKFFTSIVGLRELTQIVVRHTFFAQFVGGDTVNDTIPLLSHLRKENKGGLLAYSVEVDEHEATNHDRILSSGKVQSLPVYKQNVEEMIHSINIAADFEASLGSVSGASRKTWVALKMTALTPSSQTLINFSDFLLQNRPSDSGVVYPGLPHPSDLDILEEKTSTKTLPASLSQEDIRALVELRDDLFRICKRARERGVKVIIDAEYTWYQPAIDAYALALMRTFNKNPSRRPSSFTSLFNSTPSIPSHDTQPLIYGTFQAYLRRTPEHLQASIRDAKQNGYSLGVKLVRGAYHPHEIEYHRKRHSSTPTSLPPVWLEKPETDTCYDNCIQVLLSEVKDDIKSKANNIGVLFGTHNWVSARKVIEGLARHGLASVEQSSGADHDPVIRVDDDVSERIVIGQLYGMSDALSDYLVDHVRSPSPFVIKYIPYGALAEVMPYLGRRAIENKAVLGGPGGASEERRRAGAEIWKRVFG